MPENVFQGFRLSPQQRLLWSLHREGPVYAAQVSVSFPPGIDGKALRRALESVVARHEILRTTFRRRPGVKVPFQVVAESAEPVWTVADAGVGEGWPGPERLLAERRLLALEAPGGSLLRALLHRGGPAGGVLVLTLPALCADTRTLANLLRELGAAYGSPPRTEETEEPEEPVQYLQFSEWQNDLFEDPDGVAGRQHWRELDLSPLLPLKLPWAAAAAATSAAVPELRGVGVRIDPGTARAVEALAAARQATVSAVLLTCWQLLLWRLTGQTDVVAGALCDGRKFADLGPALGLFAKAVPVASRWEPHFRFHDMLRRVQQAEETAVELQEFLIPGEESSSPRGLEAVDVHFELAEETFAAAGDPWTAIGEPQALIDRCRLKLFCRHSPGSLMLHVGHDPDVLPAAPVARLAAQLAALLAAVVADPQAPVGELAAPGEVERHWLTRELNDTGRPAGAVAQEPVPLRIARQASLYPDRVAVQFEERRITYGDLDRSANRLAHRLRSRGVGPEVVVGLLVERSIEMVVGLLAVLKAGGAYLPLDPSLPAQRLAVLLEQAGVPVVLAQDRWLGKLPPGTVAVSLDGDPDPASGLPDPASAGSPAPPAAPAPENAAYVLFTSGSTGRPKGVVVEHRQLSHYAAAVAGRLGLDESKEGAAYALISTFAADLGNTMLFPALCGGGCLHVISAERASDPEAYAEYAERHGIDALKIVPTHFAALLQADRPERVVPRALLVLGGEACSWELIDRVAALAPACRVLNHYGPTETTVGVTVQPLVPSPWAARPSRPPIGRPLADVRAHLLGVGGAPVAAGTMGELFFGGAGVSRGYLGGPDLTAERFVPDPFGAEPGARLYRTGDLARRSDDGGFELIGRADHQVKLRGFRIELGEIEALLAGHPGVRAAVAMLREDQPEQKRIVAYVVPGSTAPAVQELRDLLSARLPEPMVPSAFVILDALPLTPNGKIDRRALPEPDRAEAQAAYAAPSNEIEMRLAEIWQEILKVDPIGVYDNFFALGGDSILAIQVISRARKAGLELQAWQIFQHQTIADLAAAAGTGPAVAAEQGAVVGEALLTPIQRWFFARGAENLNHWNQAALLDVREPLHPALLSAAVARLLSYHDALRARFEPTPVGWRQMILAESEEAGDARVATVDLSTLSGALLARTLEAAASAVQTSLNIGRGPVLRLAHFLLGARSRRLLIAVHHLVVDGISWRILLEDLQSLYTAMAVGEEPALPKKTTSFRHWGERLSAHVATGGLDGELDHWTAIAAAPVAALPADRPGGEDRVEAARTCSIELSEEETRQLLQEVPAAYHSQINDVLLTALAQAFAEWTGDRRLLLQLEGHGREPLFPDVDLSRTVGWFTTRFPVLLELAEDPGAGPGEDLKAIKEQLRRIPQHGIGFELLRYLSDAPDVAEKLRAAAVPQVTFNYLGQFDQVLAADSLLLPATEPCGPVRSPGDRRDAPIEVGGAVLRGRLRLTWTYGGERYRDETIREVADAFLRRLRALIAHCLSPEAGGFTPSDFPLAALDEEGLGRLADLLSLAAER